MRRFVLLLLCLYTGVYAYSQTIIPGGPTGFCTGGSVTLTINGAAAGAAFQWQKDGVDIGGATNVSYVANVTGNYTVIVTLGGTSTTYGPTAVTASAPPVPSFTFSPNNQCGTVPVNFTNTTSGMGLNYSWNFGDPNSGANNTSSTTNPAHSFIGDPGNAIQNFTVILTANIAGCIRNFPSTVTIKQRPDARLAGPGAGTFDGKPYFKVCTNTPSAIFNFTNTSTTSATNTAYTIVWGDATPDFTSATFPVPISHTYSVGTATMLFIVSGQNGCTDTTAYGIFVGTNPAVGLGNPGATSICTGDSLTFPVSSTSGNSPGTIYTVTFNDGTPPLTFPHPAPAFIGHRFLLTSCGVLSPGYSNSFSATIQARNPCQTSSATVVPIYVSQKAKASFSISPSDTICVNNALTVNNTSGNIAFIDNGSCSNGKVIWKVSPATGWTYSGTLGNDFNLSDAANWLSGTASVQFSFNTSGTYSIKLKTGNPNCGNDSIIRTICVNPAPVAAFNLSATTGCAPLTVTTINNSNTPICKTNTYQWAVTYSNTSGCTPSTSAYTYLNGTSATSAAPEFQFTNPGVYTISLITKNSAGLCTSSTVSQTVTVKTKPQANVTIPAAVCQNGSINPSATVNNCYATTAPTYLWTFNGGNPSTSTSSSPGTITYNTSGTYTITLKVANECDTTTVTRSITVNPAPDVTVPPNKTFCGGEPTGALSFTSSVSGTTFTWTNTNTAIGLTASGTGSISSFIAINASASPITATIVVTPASGCSGIAQSFTITINPRPAKPVVVRPVTYCLNETAVPLIATALPGNTINWYTVYQSGGSTTAQTPSTATAGNTTYFVTQTNSFNCESDTARIVVTVTPKIMNNTIGVDQTICNGANAQPFTSQATISGGSGAYQYQWQASTDGGVTWLTITGTTTATYNPGAVSANTKYRRVVNSSTCSDTSNTVTITVQGSLTNTGIGIAQTICINTQPDSVRGQLPVGGNGVFTYEWESSLNNTTWASIPAASGAGYLPPVLTVTTYYRRKTISGQCFVYSSSVQITVSPKPMMAAIPDMYLCNSSSSPIIVFTAIPSATSYSWVNNNTTIGLAASGTGSITSFIATNNSSPKVPVTATIKVAPAFTANSVSCIGDSASFNIIVLPTITLNTIQSQTKCRGEIVASLTPVADTVAFTGSSLQYTWTVSGSGITLTNGSGSQIPSYTAVNTGTTDLVATIIITPKYSYGGKTCDGTPTSYTITVKPATANANAGTDQTLCAQTTVSLSASFVNNTTGTWSQNGTTAIITSPTSTNTTVTGLLPGTIYNFIWTQMGFATCPATSDTVVIDNKPPLANKIDTAMQTICAGSTVNINGFVATGGGSGTYSYQWEQSTDGITYTPITGAVLQNITITPTTTVWLRRFVAAPPCSGYSDTVKINVQPALANNTISLDQTICIGVMPQNITGSSPTGGNNIFTYAWEQSINNGNTWTIITGATSANYSPGALTQTTKFRRVVSTALCSGQFGNTSNVITVIVNPDASALFVPTETVKCPPFVITPAIINLQPSSANNQYLWYANGTLIGSGTNFPGYTITNENDSIIIKLKVVSTFGCKDDSLSQKFKTIRKPTPSFTLTDTVGCGPITVNFTNTSTYVNEYTYFWDFGNGQTSTSIQPTAILFAPNPAYGDTTYIVNLKVFSPCDTLTFTKSIRVKSKPKALFTPTKTTGCSPMTVTFRNTSKGSNNTYSWDFGDGATLATTSPNDVQHTFITGVVDTFYVKLAVVNECGADSITYSIIVAPNTIRLNLAVNGTDRFGCAPHAVAFVNNSQGASVFRWNFGDGATTTTTKNVDTVYHTYLMPGIYIAALQAINNCSDTTTSETITLYPKPKAAFTADKFTICKGDTVRFNNLSDSATAYLWQFGDGLTSTLINPLHSYTTPGIYVAKLTTYRNNASGNVCTDSTTQPITVTPTQTGFFTVSDSVSQCAPLTVAFVNKNKPSVTALWDFGDGTTATGDSVVHTFLAFGTYQVKLIVTVPGGCTYLTTKPITVNGPGGTLRYTGGYNCSPSVVQLQAVATGTSAYIWDFGDGTMLTTTQQVVFHSYANPGFYLPKVTLQNSSGCNILLKGIDTIKVDKVDGGFRFAKNENCGATTLSFTDTSRAFFGKQSSVWSFGDGTFGAGTSPSHVYTAGGIYTVGLVVVGNSGCSDTVTKQISVLVKSNPSVAIAANATACTRRSIQFTGVIQSADTVNLTQWNISNGATGVGPVFNYIFTVPGTYTLRLVVGTVNGCFDTAYHTITINPSPVVVATPSLNLCRGSSTQLAVTGAASYQWLPLSGLTCYTCTNPVASPTITTPYVVEGKNSFGCADYDTVVITAIQPLQMNVSPADSICIGQSTNLLVSGGTSYNWSPAIGLNSTTISNPTASPTVTTTYRVVGYDGFNCFTDTAFVTVGVGNYPTINLGPDLVLPAGTLHQLTSTITNGPITKWSWTPSANLSCITCALPVANVKKSISYTAIAATAYGCSASDTITIKVTCSKDQVFVPNAFSPDGDGINDVLMVRASGIATVKYFRVFNRWGELVFEQSNFVPNNPLYGWNGRVKGVAGGPDVFVYTWEAVCENGSVLNDKGNVTIIK